jgi:PKD repeat protein
MDLSERNKFEVDVYFPSSNDYSGPLSPTASLKLQNSLMGANAWMTQTEIVHTINTFDVWHTLLFDFSDIADSINYDQIVVQLGGEGHWVPAQFYFDDFYLKHVPEINVLAPNGGEQIEQGSSFQIEWDYNYWDGDIKIELQKGQQSPQLIVYNLPASDSSFTWNVMPTQDPGDDYRVIITSLDNDFPSDTSDTYFTILEVTTVQAGFTADMSTGDPTSWEWTFEGGTPGTYSGQAPPYISYDMAGEFDVTLEVSNGSTSDILTMEDYIMVGEVPVSDFEAEPTQLIAGEQVDFTSYSSGEDLSFEWFFEGGTPENSTEENPAGVVYSSAGIYDVRLIVTNQFGSDTLVKTDYIDVMPVGLDEYELKSFSIYPNPAQDIISIETETGADYDVHITSMTGNILGKHNFNGKKIVIDINDLNPGIYLVILRNTQTGEDFVRKIIVAK